MVKKLVKFFAYTLFFFFALIAFTPKSSVYFLLEQNLKKFDVIISKESLEESLLTLHIQNLELSAKGIESAVVQNADVTLLGFYNNIALQNIELSSVVDAFLPPKIESATVSYTILNPLEIKAVAIGDFGEAHVAFDILGRKLSATLTPSPRMLKEYRSSLKEFKKDENGGYVYAKTL
jgi:hypothetical protein